MLRTGRVCRQATLTDYILLAVFIILLLVFIQRRGYTSQADNVLDSHTRKRSSVVSLTQKGQTQTDHVKSNVFILHSLVDDRIRKIPDTRENECRSKQYNIKKKVSIIIEFFDYQFYDVKTTIGSVLHHSRKELIEEIILIDDGTSLDYIKEDAKNYVTNIAKAKMIELPNRYNNGRAQMHGVQSAKGDVLVFLDSTVIVNKGWLEPLLEVLERESKVIAVPHLDSVNDPVSYDYKSTPSNLVTEFSWTLAMRMAQKVEEAKNVTQTLDSPMLRGNAFAVDRNYFNELGGYDVDMSDSNGQHVELSLRTWLCGGSIKVVPCSKVGVLAVNDAVKVVSGESVRRITHLWLGDKENYVYRNTQASPDSNPSEEQSIKSRKTVLDKMNCKPFDWFLSNVAKNVYIPSTEAKVYGLLQCKTGRCARVGGDTRIDLGQCKADSYNLHNAEMIFEYTEKKQVKYHDKCLGVLDSAYVVVQDCHDGEIKQQFDYNNGKLINIWSRYCFMHVTDPDKSVPKGRQIMMAQDCGQDNTGEFSTWEFINP